MNNMRILWRLVVVCVLILLLAAPAFAQKSRFRGMTLNPQVTDQDLADLAAYGANLVRYHIFWLGPTIDTANETEYFAWLDSELPRVDQILERCKELNMKVVLDLHTAPGGLVTHDTPALHRLFVEQWAQDALIKAWKQLATRYKGHPAVWGYDLLNEPAQREVAAGMMNWRQLAQVLVNEIRAIDPDTRIILQPIYGDQARLSAFPPVQGNNIVYSIHYYYPLSFQHQGLYGRPMGKKYPKKKFNAAALARNMKKVIAYKKKHNVEIYVGEFSAIRWAPGRSSYFYLRDLIKLFERNKFHWTYHAWREYNGWSVEHGNIREDTDVVTTPTERATLLKKHFSKNKN